MSAERETLIEAVRTRAAKEPIGCDVSDYSDEFVDGFLAGQTNMLDVLADPETYAYANVPLRIESVRAAGEDATQQRKSLIETALRDLVGVIDNDHTKGTLNYYIGPGARVLHSTDLWDAIYGAVEKARKALDAAAGEDT